MGNPCYWLWSQMLCKICGNIYFWYIFRLFLVEYAARGQHDGGSSGRASDNGDQVPALKAHTGMNTTTITIIILTTINTVTTINTLTTIITTTITTITIITITPSNSLKMTIKKVKKRLLCDQNNYHSPTWPWPQKYLHLNCNSFLAQFGTRFVPQKFIKPQPNWCGGTHYTWWL